MNDDLRDAAARAVVFQVLEQAAKARKDEAKAELAQLQPGDTVGGQWDGQLLGKATMTAGRTKLVVTDERAFVNWVAGHHPTEITSQVNPAFIRLLEQRARDVGAVIDNSGEVVPGVELQVGDCYVSVRKEKDSPFIVAQLLSSGRIALDGLKELER